MVEQISCPVCTLFLHPGMDLADHLETHPKEQVIKALVSLTSRSISTLSTKTTAIEPATETSNGQTSQQTTFYQNSSPKSIVLPATSIVQRGYPISSIQSSNNSNLINSIEDSKINHTNSNQRNLMIVNRQSTMVYQTAPSTLQLFSMPTQSSQKFLTPPPAYGTAISQLRSQNNQNINFSHHHQKQKQQQQQRQQNNNQLEISTQLPINTLSLNNNNNSCSYQNPQDYTVVRTPDSEQNILNATSSTNLIPYQTPYDETVKPICSTPIPSSPKSFGSQHSSLSSSSSSSVLRYAETPVAAKYVERDNGDFIVQESPRHVVECVEKDDGGFSVIEKVFRSPPSVVQFHGENNDEHIDENEDINNKGSTMPVENYSNDIEDDHDIVDNDGDNENNNIIQPVNNEVDKKQLSVECQSSSNDKQKKTVSGLKVLSDVKLNPNQSLDLMENIMASSSNNNDGEVLWTDLVYPLKRNNKEAIDDSGEENNVKTNLNSQELCELKDNRYNKDNNNDSMEIEKEEVNNVENLNKQNQFQSVVTTSVIRLASAKTSNIISNIVPENDVNNTCESKEIINKAIPSTSTTIINTTTFKTRSLNNKTFKKPKKLVIKFKKNPSQAEFKSELNTECKYEETVPIEIIQNKTEMGSVADLINVEIKVPHEVNLNGEMVLQKSISTSENSQNTISHAAALDNCSNSDNIGKQIKEEKTNTELLSIDEPIQPMIVHESSLQHFPDVESTPLVTENQSTDSLKTSEHSIFNAIENHEKKENIITSVVTNDNLVNEKNIEKDNELSTPVMSTSSLFPSTLLSSSASSSSSSSSSYGSFPSTSTFLPTPSTSSSALLQLQQQQQQSSNQKQTENQQSSSNYHDYSFNFLYSTPASATTSDNLLDKNSVYSCDLWKNYTGPIFQTPTNDVNDIEQNQESSYIDLDTLKKANSSDAVQFADALNIQTDEKMPAKGEISEQESNGDIENSWSQPSGGEFRFLNLGYNISRGIWNGEEFIQTVEDIKPKTSPMPESTSTENNNTQTQGELFANKRKKPTKPRNPANKSITTSLPRKIKNFKCEICHNIFPKLKDRNSHLIQQHNYKRVNRRLIRDTPAATITLEQHQLQMQQQEQLQITQQYHSEQHQLLLQHSCGIEQQNSEFPTFFQQNEMLLSNDNACLNIDNIRLDIKPETLEVIDIKTKIIPKTSSSSSSSSTAQFPTKCESLRANIFHMLMNFNFSVLKEKHNVDISDSISDLKLFSCITCKKHFPSIKLYDEHLNEHPLECYTCNKKFTKWTYFSIHLKRHIGWKDFECTHCSKRFVIRSSLVEHMRMHSGATPLKCKQCGKGFKRYSNLTQHKRMCHMKNKRKKEFVCYCGEVLPSKARFIWHREIHDTKPKCCPHCSDRFIHLNSLRRHIRLVHSDKFTYDQPAECPICKQIYAKNSLKSHMTTHSIGTQYECPICNKSFSTKWNLKIHGWVHLNRNAKPFKCDMCIKAFVRENDYKNHLNAHRQIKPFTCEFCGCKFIRKYNYLRHRREHHGKKKFRCELCGKQFHRHYYLIEHRRTHTGERPFLCTICGKSSTTKTNHNKHLKIHHSRDPFTSEA